MNKEQNKTESTTWLDRQTLDAVRPEVRALFEKCQAFKKLSPEEQRSLAADTVKVAAYMANPDGLVAKSSPAIKAFSPARRALWKKETLPAKISRRAPSNKAFSN